MQKYTTMHVRVKQFLPIIIIIYNMNSECRSISLAFLIRKKSDRSPPQRFEPGTSRIEIQNATTAPQNLLVNLGFLSSVDYRPVSSIFLCFTISTILDKRWVLPESMTHQIILQIPYFPMAYVTTPWHMYFLL